jgi:hypothetical protein
MSQDTPLIELLQALIKSGYTTEQAVFLTEKLLKTNKNETEGK